MEIKNDDNVEILHFVSQSEFQMNMCETSIESALKNLQKIEIKEEEDTKLIGEQASALCHLLSTIKHDIFLVMMGISKLRGDILSK